MATFSSDSDEEMFDSSSSDQEVDSQGSSGSRGSSRGRQSNNSSKKRKRGSSNSPPATSIKRIARDEQLDGGSIGGADSGARGGLDPFAAQADEVKLASSVRDQFPKICWENLSIQRSKPEGDEWYWSNSLGMWYRTPCYLCGKYLNASTLNDQLGVRNRVGKLHPTFKLRVFTLCNECCDTVALRISEDPQVYNGKQPEALYFVHFKVHQNDKTMEKKGISHSLSKSN